VVGYLENESEHWRFMRSCKFLDRQINYWLPKKYSFRWS